MVENGFVAGDDFGVGVFAPADGDRADVVAVGLLRRGAGVAGEHILARDLAVAGVEIDDGTLSCPTSGWT